MQTYVCEAADGRLSVIHIDPLLVSFPPLIFKWLSLHKLPLHIHQKAGRHVAAWSQSCPCICSIWLSHRNMIYIAFLQAVSRQVTAGIMSTSPVLNIQTNPWNRLELEDVAA